MANHKSALKKSKQDQVRRMRNRSGRSTLRTALKNIRAELAEGSNEAAEKLPQIYSLIDRSAKKGFIHQNAAARLKSNLSRQAGKSA